MVEVWIHPTKLLMEKDREMKLTTPCYEIKLEFLVTITT